jgi:hypothetical protein
LHFASGCGLALAVIGIALYQKDNGNGKRTRTKATNRKPHAQCSVAPAPAPAPAPPSSLFFISLLSATRAADFIQLLLCICHLYKIASIFIYFSSSSGLVALTKPQSTIIASLRTDKHVKK